MKFPNRDIPGQMSDGELLRLRDIAQRLPWNGIIVESGALYGLSTWHWSKSCRPGTTVFTIDPWQRGEWIVKLVEEPQGAPFFNFEAFLQFTEDCHNVVPIRGRSPEIVRGWQLPIDCYFDDAIHENPALNVNLSFWRRFVKPGGIMCGHDYCPDWPDVIKEAHALADREATDLQIVGSLWSIVVK